MASRAPTSLHPWVNELLERVAKRGDGQWVLAREHSSPIVARAVECSRGDEVFAFLDGVLDLLTLLATEGTDANTLDALTADVLVPVREHLAMLAARDVGTRRHLEALDRKQREQDQALRRPQGVHASLGAPKTQLGVGLRGKRR